MGIHGIYKEIGPGRRIALSKLAVEKFEETGRPLRIAIDTSIWLFQIQASKGGTNPALRTFYYRLLRLIALSIHPIFVFDGPNKPPFKRNKRTGPNVASIPEFLAKQLLKQFGYPIHLAPGEAEAECALLQREGIVDAVLSEDVDTLMFGSGITIRNWSAETAGKTPTHVNVYDAVETKNGPSGLDREGMILVALMSGGDYVPEGIPGCGPKTACEAAKAGFGHDLRKIPRGDAPAMRQWRERLQHELKTNQSKLFRRKHGALKIPTDFPRLDILGYYTHPAISNQSGLDKLRRSIKWDQDVDLQGLREFTGDAFDWARLEGAKHFIRSLAPSLVVRQLRLRAQNAGRLPTDDVQAIQEDESLLIKSIHGKRQHPVTDNTTELRVSFTPIELVKIDLSQEEPDDEPDETPPGSQMGEADLDEDVDLEDEGPKKRGPTKFDPQKPARIWVLESFVKVGVPLKVQDWEAQRQVKQKPRRAATDQAAPKAKPTTRRTKTTGNLPQPPIQQFAKVTKPVSRLARILEKTQDTAPIDSAPPASRSQMSVVDLLSSSPVRATSRIPASQPSREKSLSPVLEDLPPSVSKRRRRAPIQRAHTMPAKTNGAQERPTSPPLVDATDTLDLVSSPALLSPSGFFAKKVKTASKVTRGTSVTSSPGKGRQTTLDAWRASATPTQPRQYFPDTDDAPVPSPPKFQASTAVDELDLTLSSPVKPLPRTTQPTTMSRHETREQRTPLASVSYNSSQRSSRSMSQGLRQEATGGRTSNPKCASTCIDTLDLISSSPPPLADETFTPEPDVLDLTTLSSPSSARAASPPSTLTPQSPTPSQPPGPNIRRSPRNHTSLSPEPASRTSPPAAWKAREKKKRQIILRQSVAGAWDFVDVDSPVKGVEASAGTMLKGKERRAWRESQVEFLDLS